MEFFAVVGLVFLTAAIFVIWFAVTIARLIVGALFGFGKKAKPAVVHETNGHVACRHSNCRAMNPPCARFCKRCGKATGFVPQALRYVA